MGTVPAPVRPWPPSPALSSAPTLCPTHLLPTHTSLPSISWLSTCPFSLLGLCPACFLWQVPFPPTHMFKSYPASAAIQMRLFLCNLLRFFKSALILSLTTCPSLPLEEGTVPHPHPPTLLLTCLSMSLCYFLILFWYYFLTTIHEKQSVSSSPSST